MGVGMCSRCPKVGREGAFQNQKSPSHPSYCKQCIREYNQDRYRKQTSMKDFSPLLMGMVSELALVLAEEHPNISTARTITGNILAELRSFSEELERVNKRPSKARGTTSTPTLESLVAQYNGLIESHKEPFKLQIIHQHYPDWEPSGDGIIGEGSHGVAVVRRETNIDDAFPDSWKTPGFQLTGPPPPKSED